MIDDDNDEIVADLIATIQHGHIDDVREALKDRQLVNSCDKDGCSLLHWAAINNRCEIANLLIEIGANLNYGGGILGECPLQWAMRRKYYHMALLLLNAGCDINHKSKQGTDALHVACHLGDINSVLMLLHWGANANSTDFNGHTPLYWVLMNKCDKDSLDIIRLLLKAGGDVLHKEPDTGNTAMHILISTPMQQNNLKLAYLLHTAGGVMVATTQNSSGLTAYTQATMNRHMLMSRFLYDMMLVNFLPSWITVTLAVGCIASGFLSLYCFGWILGLVVWLALYGLVWQHLLQLHVEAKLDRVHVGSAIGVMLSLGVIYQLQVVPWISTVASMWMYLVTALFVHFCVKFHRTKPHCLSINQRDLVVTKILEATCPDGPDTDEADQQQQQSSHHHHHHRQPHHHRVEVVPRPSAPRPCTVCMTDRRRATTHCLHCDACVVHMDQHVNWLHNCVGRGNRRLFAVVLLMGTVMSVCFTWTTYWAQSVVYCPAAKGLVWNVLAVQWCVMNDLQHRVTVLASVASSCLSMMLVAALQTQLVLVSREATLFNVLHGKFDRSWTTTRDKWTNLYRFVCTGAFEVSYYHQLQLRLHNEQTNNSTGLDVEAGYVGMTAEIDEYVSEDEDVCDDTECRHHHLDHDHHKDEGTSDELTQLLSTVTMNISADDR